MSLRKDLRTVATGWRWGSRPIYPRSVEAEQAPSNEFPTAWARTPLAQAARSVILRFGFAPLIRYEIDASVHGLQNLEGLDPPVVFAANHSSHIDAPLILVSLPRQWRNLTAVGAAADYFFDVWWRAVGTALAFNTFPVERTGSRRSAGPAQDLIEEGWNILVFPEGTRARDGWMGDFRHGVSRLALKAKVPVVPISLRGAYQAMPRGRGWPAPGRPPVTVRFGKPIPPDSETIREASGRIRRALALGYEEDRTSWWEALRRDADSDGAALIEAASGPQGAEWRRLWESSRPHSHRRSESAPSAPSAAWKR